jgi:hypothetical protein
MESWQVGDIIYRGDIYAEFIDIFKILHLGYNSCGTILAHIESLFTGTCNDILISNDKNEDLVVYNAIYSCNVNRVYEFIQKHKASF